MSSLNPNAVKYLGLITLALLLSACANTNRLSFQPEPSTAWRQSLNQMDSWQLEGKAGLKSKESYNTLTVNWTEQGDSYQVKMTGPMGQGQLSLEGTPQQILLTTPQGRYVSDDPQALLRQHTGWPIPLTQLTYWIKGTPAPGKVKGSLYDDQGRLLSLDQAGWRLDYLEFQQQGQAWLPRKLTVKRDDLELKLVIKQWQVN
ncbi:hypothetical protein WH50_23900 [Pokkaliibacter plantistimulans]|uniref:Outer-membrane lipoprotein LolB n=1 Tax=Pokkaliibacter plantistimulans TaxID=1635171 RepID=A0ABX5LTL0_9GAMM|nr:lipoprotein insertase outer membrane protein LolB [Pokkaliibacter plantistimulans]PXF28853.1 hypothetical protein WH50_23900 [Pokkaliibacter plantistimulans]